MNLDSTGGECMCRAAGGNNMVWPATRCGETRVISCFSSEDAGMLSRACGADGRWSDFIQGNCTCAEELEFETAWPATRGGETAHVACVNSHVRTRDRLCRMNGEWDDVMTGGCWCVAGEFQGIQWEETEGGREAEHVCDFGALGEPYRRFCGVDGGWSAVVAGSCRCPETEAEGEVWLEAEPGATQQVTCSEGAVGRSMNRTCGVYGSWEAIVGNCDCPEEEVDGVLWPQTAAGVTALVSCAPDAVGTPSTRECLPGGTWSLIRAGSCACPAEDWTNFAGTRYHFDQTPAGSSAVMSCAKGLEGSISRECGLFGVWGEPVGCHEDVFCPEETVGVLHFNRTLGGSTVMHMCHGDSSMSYGRLCGENGVWSEVVGYCECPAEEDAQHNKWPATRGNETYSQQCETGYKGAVSRYCSFFGEWVETLNTCERYVCPAEELDGIQWPETLSLETATVACSGAGEGLHRRCNEVGQWEPVTGGCACAAEEAEGFMFPATQGGATAEVPCAQEGAVYTGVVLRACSLLGVWGAPENQCFEPSCKGEVFESVSWPDTPVGTVARVNCTGGFNERRCGSDGTWATEVSGPGCLCSMTTVEANGQTYVFDDAFYNGGEPVSITCAALYEGTISYTCLRSGEWGNLENRCTRITCPYETIQGLSFPETDSNTVRHLPCDEGAVGAGYDRFCSASGEWEPFTGSCSCPENELRHSDGHLYYFNTTRGGEVVSQVCAGDLAGSVSRTCSLFGSWQPLNGECTQLLCPAEVYENYFWPATNSSTELSFPCSNYQTGSVTRKCHSSGVWEDPVFNCQEKVCQGVTITRLDGNAIRFQLDLQGRYVQASVVPCSSPEQEPALHLSTLQISNLKPNVAYSLFLSYFSDANLTTLTDQCMLSNIYYRQTCDTMQPPDVVDIVEEDAGSTSIQFSSLFTACPGEAQQLEVKVKCTEQCGSMEPETVRVIECSDLGGCRAGERAEFRISAEFPTNALFEVQQRLLYSEDSADLTPFSSLRAFRIRDLLRPNYITPTLEYINSQMVRLSLGDIAQGSVAYSKHEIYIYKKLTGTRRRLVDSLFSIVTLCPLGNSVCSDTFTDVVVEPGYTYSFSIYSYMMVGNRKTVSVATIDVYLLPPFSMTVDPGDYYISVGLNNALYPLSGTCSFISQKLATQTLVTVELPKLEPVDVVVTGLLPSSEYTVTCALHDELGLENRQTFTVTTLPVFLPTLSLTLLSNTVYDVSVNALVNKPVSLYCKVSEKQLIPSKEELKVSGTYFNVQTLNGFEVALQLPTLIDSEQYRVTCVAEDQNGNSDLQSLLVTEPPSLFSPELVSRYPELDAVNVAPMVTMRLTFKYPVVVSNCTSCFFMLRDLKQHTTTNIYAPYFTVDGASIVFNTRQLAALTEYRLEASTYKLIQDAHSGVLFQPEEDYLLHFTIRDYVPIEGEVVFPGPTDLFPVNGTIRVEFPTSYLFLNEGSLSLNALSVAADDACLQIQHPSATSTVLLIPVEDCVGVLRAKSTYVLSFPEGFLRARDYMLTDRMTRLFETEDSTFFPSFSES